MQMRPATWVPIHSNSHNSPIVCPISRATCRNRRTISIRCAWLSMTRHTINKYTQAGVSSTGSSDLDCQVSIITVVTSPSDPPQVISTIMPMQLTASRTTLDLTSSAIDPTWTNPITFYLKQMPTAVDVVVMQTGTLRFQNGSWPYR